MPDSTSAGNAPPPKPRWSVRRWIWTGIAVVLSLLLIVGVALVWRYEQRRGFQLQMRTMSVPVSFFHRTPYDSARTLHEGPFLVLFGQMHILICAEPGLTFFGGFGEIPGTTQWVQEVLGKLDGRTDGAHLVLTDPPGDDAVLGDIPPERRFASVRFSETSVTEGGLRKFCQRHQPQTVEYRTGNFSADAIDRLRSEFPGIEFNEREPR